MEPSFQSPGDLGESACSLSKIAITGARIHCYPHTIRPWRSETPVLIFSLPNFAGLMQLLSELFHVNAQIHQTMVDELGCYSPNGDHLKLKWWYAPQIEQPSGWLIQGWHVRWFPVINPPHVQCPHLNPGSKKKGHGIITNMSWMWIQPPPKPLQLALVKTHGNPFEELGFVDGIGLDPSWHGNPFQPSSRTLNSCRCDHAWWLDTFKKNFWQAWRSDSDGLQSPQPQTPAVHFSRMWRTQSGSEELCHWLMPTGY